MRIRRKDENGGLEFIREAGVDVGRMGSGCKAGNQRDESAKAATLGIPSPPAEQVSKKRDRRLFEVDIGFRPVATNTAGVRPCLVGGKDSRRSEPKNRHGGGEKSAKQAGLIQCHMAGNKTRQKGCGVRRNESV